MDPSEAALCRAGWNCMSGNSETSCTAGEEKIVVIGAGTMGAFECIGSESRRL